MRRLERPKFEFIQAFYEAHNLAEAKKAYEDSLHSFLPEDIGEQLLSCQLNPEILKSIEKKR